jgi:hypothetical protein
MIAEKLAVMDYELTEAEDFLALRKQAEKAIESSRRPACMLYSQICATLVSLAELILYGGVISSTHPSADHSASCTERWTQLPVFGL